MACIRKIVEGKYRVDYRDQHGRRLRKFFDTRKEADSFLTDVKRKLETGTFVSPRDVPTFATMAREWLEAKRANNYAAATLETWGIHLDNHLLLPDHGIGTLRLDRIDASVMERFARGRKEAGLAPQTVNKLLTTATAVFKYAVRHRRAVVNPAALAERLKVGAPELRDGQEGDRTGAEVRNGEVLTPEELKRLLGAARPGFDRTFLSTVALTGIRHGEALALMWPDIDLEAGKMTVRRNLTWAKAEKTERRQHRFNPPKTRSGRRTIELPPELAHALKVWKLQCPKGELQLVFPNAAGLPEQRKNTLDNVLYPTLERAGLARRIVMHGLRHTFASILIMRGEPVTRVASVLGHRDPTITLAVYSHWFKDRTTDTMNDLAREMFAPADTAGIRG